MAKKRYLNEKELNKKGLGIIFAVAFVFLLFILITAITRLNEQNEAKTERIESGDFETIQEIVESYGCRFIKQEESTEAGYYYDIYLVFKYDLYTNGESNEEFYTQIIEEIAEFFDYINFRMFDTAKDESIEIRVIANSGKVKKIYINGIEDYFIYMDSKINLSDYEELPTTTLSIESPELISCIDNSWSTDTDFGTRETIFQDYYIYFDEGIETRKISGKIYNIVFTEQYEKTVVNGFTVGENYDIIENELGDPTFEDKENNIIGYKSDDIYIFFTENQISVYRNTEEDGFDEFFELVDSFLDDEYTLLEFMNELTYIWPDYDEYSYSSDTVFLSYPNKGIDIKMNYDDTNGIVVYNNIGMDIDTLAKYFEHTEFIGELGTDNVFLAEQRRAENVSQLQENCNEYEEEYESDDDRNHGTVYDYYVDLSSSGNVVCTYFISQSTNYPNCELSENVSSYIWISDYCFVYGVYGKGLYYYDLKNQIRGVLVTGEDDFEIESYENNILKYDEQELQIVY